MRINKLVLFSTMLAAFSSVFTSSIDENQPVAIEFLDQEDATQPAEMPEEIDQEMLAPQAAIPSDELTDTMIPSQSLANEEVEALVPEQENESTKPAILTISAELTKIRNEIENMKSALSSSMATIEGTLRSIDEMLQGL